MKNLDLLRKAIRKARKLEHGVDDAGPLDETDTAGMTRQEPFVLREEMLVPDAGKLRRAIPVYRLENK